MFFFVHNKKSQAFFYYEVTDQKVSEAVRKSNETKFSKFPPVLKLLEKYYFWVLFLF